MKAILVTERLEKLILKGKEVLDSERSVRKSTTTFSGNQSYYTSKELDIPKFDAWLSQSKTFISTNLGVESHYLQDFTKATLKKNGECIRSGIAILEVIKEDFQHEEDNNKISEISNEVIKGGEIFIVHGHDNTINYQWRVF